MKQFINCCRCNKKEIITDNTLTTQFKHNICYQCYLFELAQNNKRYWSNKNYRDKRKGKMRKYIQDNKEAIKEYKQKYYESNKEIIKAKSAEYKNNHKQFYKDYMREYIKARKKKDIQYYMQVLLRDRVSKALREYTQLGKIKSSDSYGIDYKAIITYLETNDPLWNDYKINKHKYHIDHKICIASFDLTNSEDIRKAFAPSNHQILLIKDNLQKVSEDLKVIKIKKDNAFKNKKAM